MDKSRIYELGELPMIEYIMYDTGTDTIRGNNILLMIEEFIRHIQGIPIHGVLKTTIVEDELHYSLIALNAVLEPIEDDGYKLYIQGLYRSIMQTYSEVLNAHGMSRYRDAYEQMMCKIDYLEENKLDYVIFRDDKLERIA